MHLKCLNATSHDLLNAQSGIRLAVNIVGIKNKLS